MTLVSLVQLYLICGRASGIIASNKRPLHQLYVHFSMSSGGGRGEYYKNKYGGGRGGGRGGPAGRLGPRDAPQRTKPATGGTSDDLYRLLERIDGRQYPFYRDIETDHGWRFRDFTLFIGRTQGDPFAPPTRVRIVVPGEIADFPSTLYSKKVRAMGLADFLHRILYDQCKEVGADASLGGTGWSGPKGGDVAILSPCQHVLEQTAVQMSPLGDVIAQVTVNLPARGRTILGRAAIQIMENLTCLVEKALKHANLQADRIEKHVDSIDDQVWLQSQLDSQGLVAFVRDGAMLPRLSGANDTPMKSQTAVPFQSPASLRVSFMLPNAGTKIHGMGIRKGVSIIVGGGFHGKSTLLDALQVGVYPKVPGDGRDFVVTSPNAIKIRAEDGRSVTAVDISPFISNLPFGKDTKCFSTPDASGSTSQAANIVEAMEIGADLLLVDEDTCATNFMIRDDKMMKLVAPHKEPITPFVRKVRAMYQEWKISSIIVIGGAGDFFDVADSVMMMDNYKCEDVTKQAQAIVAEHPSSCTNLPFGTIRSRFAIGSLFESTGQSKVLSSSAIRFGDDELDLSGLEQIVSKAQTTAIVMAIQKFASLTDAKSLAQGILQLDQLLDLEGLDGLAPSLFHGGMARPRPLELAGAINRFRVEGCIDQSNLGKK